MPSTSTMSIFFASLVMFRWCNGQHVGLMPNGTIARGSGFKPRAEQVVLLSNTDDPIKKVRSVFWRFLYFVSRGRMHRGLAFYNELLYYALVSKLAYNANNSSLLHRLQITSDIHLIRNAQSRCVVFRKDGKLIIGFAGTSELRNWCINLKAHKAPYVCDTNSCGKTHAGFRKYYKSISHEIIEHTNRYIQDTNIPINNKQIVFAGHSRGGSCVLAALEVSFIPQCPEIICYTYGSPRIGDAVFASEFERRIKRCYRVTNRFDLVTTLPAYIGFQHVGLSVHLDQAEFRLDGWMYHHKLSTYIHFLERYITEKERKHNEHTPNTSTPSNTSTPNTPPLIN
jgi:hypothetical protein